LAKNMVFKRYGRLWVIVHNKETPTAKEWDSYLDAVRDVDLDKVRTLVFTDGGGPDVKQREKINQFLQGQETRVGVISNSVINRGAITALSWFNKGIKSFRPDEWQGAFEYLEIAHADWNQVWDLIRLLQRDIGAESSRSIQSPMSGVGSAGHAM
jgi:hypothetical protein